MNGDNITFYCLCMYGRVNFSAHEKERVIDAWIDSFGYPAHSMKLKRKQ